MIGWLRDWPGRDPRTQFTEKDISPYFWPNGTMPNSAAFDDLVAKNFADYRLRISGLVERPRDLSMADLKAMPKQEQITTISASRDGRASPNGAASPCATFSIW